MKKLGTFVSRQWGTVMVMQDAYADRERLAITLLLEDGEPLATLSVNIPDAEELPVGCFYVKDWSENAAIADEAFQSGLFVTRMDLPSKHTGFVAADVWQLKGADNALKS